MNSYDIRIIHPEWGECGSLSAQGSSAMEALENASAYGINGSHSAVVTAVVRNISTGFCTRIEFTYGG